MANKRMFKKNVEAIGAALCDEMMAAYYNIKGVDKKAIEKAIGIVLGAVETARANSNVFFDRGMKSFEDHKAYGKAKGEFFRALFNRIEGDYNTKIGEALKLFNDALPADVKAQNKEYATAE